MAPRSGRPGLPPRRRKRRSREFGRATTPVLPKRSPSPGRWIRPGRCPPSGATATAQFVDWPADPHQTPSGGGHRADPGQKRDPARRLRKKGIDQSTPVTEGWAKARRAVPTRSFPNSPIKKTRGHGLRPLPTLQRSTRPSTPHAARAEARRRSNPPRALIRPSARSP
jgi:hypothetical protein